MKHVYITFVFVQVHILFKTWFIHCRIFSNRTLGQIQRISYFELISDIGNQYPKLRPLMNIIMQYICCSLHTWELTQWLSNIIMQCDAQNIWKQLSNFNQLQGQRDKIMFGRTIYTAGILIFSCIH